MIITFAFFMFYLIENFCLVGGMMTLFNICCFGVPTLSVFHPKKQKKKRNEGPRFFGFEALSGHSPFQGFYVSRPPQLLTHWPYDRRWIINWTLDFDVYIILPQGYILRPKIIFKNVFGAYHMIAEIVVYEISLVGYFSKIWIYI